MHVHVVIAIFSAIISVVIPVDGNGRFTKGIWGQRGASGGDREGVVIRVGSAGANSNDLNGGRTAGLDGRGGLGKGWEVEAREGARPERVCGEKMFG